MHEANHFYLFVLSNWKVVNTSSSLCQKVISPILLLILWLSLVSTCSFIDKKYSTILINIILLYINTQYPKPTQNLLTQHNLIISSGHRPNFDGWSCLTKYWLSFANFDYSFFTIWPSNWWLTSPTPISHHIFPV